jgi:D-methionine transport system substrate-binding protein
MALFGLMALTACHKTPDNTLLIGTIAGPETELVQIAAQIAEKQYGIHIKIIEFNDYNLPNQALNDGSLDANVYQHLPYLTAANQAHGYHLIAVGKTFLYPMGIYSKRIHALTELPESAFIALPNDPSNQTRALKLLQQAQLITLNTAELPTLHDIISNPHHARFKELDAAQLPHALADVDLAVIHTTFAIPAGLNPIRDALVRENRDSPYANVIVMKQGSPKQAQIEQFVQAFQTPAVKQRAAALFSGAALAAW